MRSLLFATIASGFVFSSALGQRFSFGVHQLPNQSIDLISSIIGSKPDGTEVAYRQAESNTTQGYTLAFGGVPSLIPSTPAIRNYYYAASDSLDAFALSTNINLGVFQATYLRQGETPRYLGVRQGYNVSAATNITRNGDTVFGYDIRQEGASDVFMEPFRWTPSGGRENLGHARPGAIYTQITDISADGNIAVGYSGVDGMGTPFTWTPTTGYTFLPAPVGGSAVSAYGVTPDGRVVVGAAGVTGLHAAIWRDITQPPQLLDQWYSSSGHFIARNGDMIIGGGRSDPPGTTPGALYRAFIWTQQSGMMTATDYLREVGVQLPADAKIPRFDYVSDDGTMLGCRIETASGSFGALIVIPAPSTILTLAPIVLLPGRRRR